MANTYYIFGWSWPTSNYVCVKRVSATNWPRQLIKQLTIATHACFKKAFPLYHDVWQRYIYSRFKTQNYKLSINTTMECLENWERWISNPRLTMEEKALTHPMQTAWRPCKSIKTGSATFYCKGNTTVGVCFGKIAPIQVICGLAILTIYIVIVGL